MMSCGCGCLNLGLLGRVHRVEARDIRNLLEHVLLHVVSSRSYLHLDPALCFWWGSSPFLVSKENGPAPSIPSPQWRNYEVTSVSGLGKEQKTDDIGSLMEMALAHSSGGENRRIIDNYHNCSFLEVRESEVHPSIPLYPEQGT